MPKTNPARNRADAATFHAMADMLATAVGQLEATSQILSAEKIESIGPIGVNTMQRSIKLLLSASGLALNQAREIKLAKIAGKVSAEAHVAATVATKPRGRPPKNPPGE